MGHPCCLEVEGADGQVPFGQRFDVERVGAEARVVVQPVEAVVEAGRTEDADASTRLLVAQVVTQRDEVDEVVRVEVADDDRVERARVDVTGQPREGALAEVEDEARAVEAEQVGGAGRAGPVRVGRARTDDVEAHGCYRAPSRAARTALLLASASAAVVRASAGTRGASSSRSIT